MNNDDLSDGELRRALAAADRGMRLPHGSIVAGAGLAALAIAVVLRFVDWANTTHILIVGAAAFLYGQTMLALSVITARQNAANARMLRALEVLENRIAPR